MFLELFLMFVLHFEAGTSGGETFLHHRAGEAVALLCNAPSCSDVNWLYIKDENTDKPEKVQNGKVVQSSPGAARMSLDGRCSLIITNITAEDAGRYTCRTSDGVHLNSDMYLSILTISSPKANPAKNGDVTLECSLWRHPDLYSCLGNIVRWVNEAGTELTGTDETYNLRRRRRKCVSSLTLKPQIGQNRRFTCQFVEGSHVMVETHYIPVFSGFIVGGETHLYHGPGDDVVLRCDIISSFNTYPCSNFEWLYNRKEGGTTEIKVKNGEVSQRSPPVSVDDKCSLIINNITAEDAGRYTCRFNPSYDSLVNLNILMISHPDADPTEDEVTLHCSLLRFTNNPPCPEDSIRWVDETGAVLTGDGDGFRFGGQTNCVSYLTLKRQTGQNRRLSCQYVEGNKVKTETHYPRVSTAQAADNLHIIIGAVTGGLVFLLVVAAAVLLKCRRTNVTEDQKHLDVQTSADQPPQTHHPYDEMQPSVTYATVDHFNPKAPNKIKVKEEETLVTYSTVRMNTKTEEDFDPNSLYSRVNKPK